MNEADSIRSAGGSHDAIVTAVEQVLVEEPRTRDLGGKASTTEVGEAIAKLI